MGTEDLTNVAPIGGPPAVEGPMVQHTTIIRCAGCTHHKMDYWVLDDGSSSPDWGFDHFCRQEGREIGANDTTPAWCPFLCLKDRPREFLLKEIERLRTMLSVKDRLALVTDSSSETP